MQIVSIVRSGFYFFLLTVVLSLSSKAQQNFIIRGSLVDMAASPSKVYLVYDTGHYHPTDSAIVANGKYTFKGSTDGVARLTISTSYFDYRSGSPAVVRSTATSAEIFVDGGAVDVVSTGQMEKAVVTGSKPDQDYRVAHLRQALLIDSMRAIVKMAQETKNDALLRLVMKKVLAFEEMIKTDYVDFVRQHPASPIDVYLLQTLCQVTPVAGWMDTVAALYHGLSANVQQGHDGKALGLFLNTELKTALGHAAPDFTQNDTEGHAISLSSFKGKYVLLDFWASWDNNAAGALAILAKAYDTYGSKGLVVLGVSLDKDKSSWLQMIQEGGAGSTKQVSDLKGRANTAAQLYGVTELPRNLLIDPGGIIIARNLTSLSLDKTLSSIFE